MIKSKEEIKLMEVAGLIVGKTHNYLKKYIKPGIKTIELDELAYNFIINEGATPSFKDYQGFPNTICISINEEVVHGIPSNRSLKEGDIVSIDIGANYKGYHGDSAWTYPVGKINKEKQFLLKHTEKALFEGIKVVKAGIRVGEIGHAIEQYIKRYKLGIVKELVGHGVGKELHEEPDVPNYGSKKEGLVLKEGMIIAIEPMINYGTADVYIKEDGWTIVTADNQPSAHFEHTILILKDGAKILTKR